MRGMSLVLLFGTVSLGRAADLKDLPPNTFVEIKYTTEQIDANDRGQFARQGWNKIVYDPDGKRVLFYDRWVDKKHGGWTIYGNCLFALDPGMGKLTPITVDNWTKLEPKGGGYRTLGASRRTTTGPRPARDTSITPSNMSPT